VGALVPHVAALNPYTVKVEAGVLLCIVVAVPLEAYPPRHYAAYSAISTKPFLVRLAPGHVSIADTRYNAVDGA